MIENVNCVLDLILLGLILYNCHLEHKISKNLHEQLYLIDKQDKQIMGYVSDLAQYLSDYEKNVADYANRTEQTLNFDRISNRNNLKIITQKIHDMEEKK